MKEKNNINIFKLTWKMILYRPWLFAANVVLWTLIFAYNAIPSFIVREFFNRLSEKTQQYNEVLWLLALLLAAAIGRAVVVYLGGDAFVRFEFYVNSLFRRNILENLFKKPGAEALKVSSGEALNILKDDVEQATLILDALLDITGFTVFSVIAICILIKINAYVTFFVFAPLVVVVIIAKKATHRIQKNRRESRSITSDVSGMLGEIFNGIQAVKVSGAEKNIIGQLHRLNRNRHRLMLRDTLFRQLLDSVYKSTVSLGTGLILLLVAQSMRSGSFTVGDFALFVYYLTFVTDFTQRFGDFLAVVKQGEVSFERMSEFLQGIEPEKLLEYKPFYEKLDSARHSCDKEHEKLNCLEVNNLNYKYPDSENGIRDINLSVKKGTFTVITGKIGSGKTTLIKTILGLLTANSGIIMWNNKPVERPDMFCIPPHTAYTAQVPHLFSDTVRNNILLGIDENTTDIDDSISSAVLEGDITELEDGLDTIVGNLGKKLSGGQIQRVAAARMFARNSELYIFDDISSALDIETEETLWNRLFNKMDTTCIAVSNKKSVFQHADNIIVMKDGRIEAQGKLEELLQSCDEFQRIWA